MVGTPPSRLDLAVVTETFPPDVNGVAKTVFTMVSELAARGHAIHLYRPRLTAGTCAPGSTPFTQTTLPGARIPIYRELHFGLPCTRFLRRTWRTAPPDLVHVVTEGPLGWSAIRAAKALKIPVVSDFRTRFSSYSHYYHLGFLSPLVAAYLKSLHNSTSRTLVPTPQLQAALANDGYTNLAVAGRGIDTTLYSPSKRDPLLRKQWGLSMHDTAVLYVGRLAPEKNIDLLGLAYRRMKTINPRLRMVFVGDGPSRKTLHRLAPEAIFSGMQQGEALARHYASGDVLLFPSTTETFGNVILEAMASALAIVAFDYAAARQYLTHDYSALLAPYADEVRFIECAETLASSSETIERLRRGAHTASRSCSWSAVINDMEALYYSVLKETAHPAASLTPSAHLLPLH